MSLDPLTGARNLADAWRALDPTDRDEGLLAYERYHVVMRLLAAEYRTSVERVAAVFAATSPNNDYTGNLRSTVSILVAVRDGLPLAGTTVSTYRHCRDRAWAYATGAENFATHARGPKTLAFYYNILDPSDPSHVTIDGHMVGVWRACAGTMKDLKVSRREYRTIQAAITALACGARVVPCQVQAMLWFHRKRTLRVLYNPQLSLLGDVTDQWRTARDPREISPFPRSSHSDRVGPERLPGGTAGAAAHTLAAGPIGERAGGLPPVPAAQPVRVERLRHPLFQDLLPENVRPNRKNAAAPPRGAHPEWVHAAE